MQIAAATRSHAECLDAGGVWHRFALVFRCCTAQRCGILAVQIECIIELVFAVKPVEWYRGLGGVWHKFSEGIPSGNADAFSLRLLEQTASMSVAPPSFRNGQSVTVSWQGVPNPTAADFIGMYFPTTAQDNEFYDFVFANTVRPLLIPLRAPDALCQSCLSALVHLSLIFAVCSVIQSPTYAQGHGSVTFTLLNLRGAYQFRYVGNATQQAHVVATSEVSALCCALRLGLFCARPPCVLACHARADPVSRRLCRPRT